MKPRLARNAWLRGGAALSCLILMAAQTTAFARDGGGIQEFLAEQFGFGAPQAVLAPTPGPVWSDDNPYDRPLLVRPHRKKTKAVASRAVVATVKGPVGPVSIYEDKTLRRGDAVMTKDGIRIFQGSNTLPYRDSDFVAISQDGRLSRDVTKTLLAMDHVPRS